MLLEIENSNNLNVDYDDDHNMNGIGDVGKMNQIGSTSSHSISSQLTMGIGNQQTLCCLFDDSQRCTRVASSATFPKRIDKQLAQKRLRLTLDQRAGHLNICDHHKQMIQSLRTGKRKRKDSDDENSNDNDFDSQSEIDLASLQVNTLRRYKRHYRIQTRPGLNKGQLAEVRHCNCVIGLNIIIIIININIIYLHFFCLQILLRHFKSIPVYEKEAITYFIYMVKCNKNKLDNMKSSGSLPID